MRRRFVRGRRRDDAIDHGRREGAAFLDPCREGGGDAPGEVEDDAAKRLAVGRHVVAAEHGEGRHPRDLAPREGGGEITDGRARGLEVSEVMGDVGVIGIERAGGGIVAIALLRHRQ